jgi:hypothetical protein
MSRMDYNRPAYSHDSGSDYGALAAARSKPTRKQRATIAALCHKTGEQYPKGKITRQ